MLLSNSGFGSFAAMAMVKSTGMIDLARRLEDPAETIADPFQDLNAALGKISTSSGYFGNLGEMLRTPYGAVFVGTQILTGFGFVLATTHVLPGTIVYLPLVILVMIIVGVTQAILLRVLMQAYSGTDIMQLFEVAGQQVVLHVEGMSGGDELRRAAVANFNRVAGNDKLAERYVVQKGLIEQACLGIATVYIYVAIPTFMHQLYSGDVSWDEAVANDYEARENSVFTECVRGQVEGLTNDNFIAVTDFITLFF